MKRRSQIGFLPVFCSLVLIAVVAVSAFIIVSVAKPSETESEPDLPSSSEVSSVSSQPVSSDDSSDMESEATESEIKNENGLDTEFKNLLLVNGKNPLPEDFDYDGNLAIIEDKYLCGARNRMNEDVLPYATAMVEAAWEDGVDLYILSPYRSYGVQTTLYENEVKEWEATGLDREEAEIQAATEVARPGTSEHHTGLAADFNSVETSFENTEMFKWLEENAADYGFIMRYSADKEPITGVIYEPWHWRFVGIEVAHEINSLDMCLEEYLEYKEEND